MGWLIALAIVVLLGTLPLGVSAKYDSGGPLVRLIAGPFRIVLVPAKKKPQKAKRKKPKEQPVKEKDTASSKTKENPKQEKSGGSLADFFPLVDAVLDFLGDFFCRKLRVNVLKLKLILAGDDPCDLAVNYGRAWAALGNLVPQLERFFVIQKRDMQVECDFTADKTLIDAQLDLTITLGRLLGLGVRYGTRVLREFLKIVKLKKGGAVK